MVACKADAAPDTARATARRSARAAALGRERAPLPAATGAAERRQASLAEQVADGLDAPVVGGAPHLAAAKPVGRPDEDALICGDDDAAKALALELAGRVVDGRAFDAGPLEHARALEGMTAASSNVNKRYRAHAGIRLTGA